MTVVSCGVGNGRGKGSRKWRWDTCCSLLPGMRGGGAEGIAAEGERSKAEQGKGWSNGQRSGVEEGQDTGAGRIIVEEGV